jgi:hypothetical protein
VVVVEKLTHVEIVAGEFLFLKGEIPGDLWKDVAELLYVLGLGYNLVDFGVVV